MSQALFLIVAAGMVGTAFAVVCLRNPVFCALALILNFLGMAALYAMLGAHFLAAAQIIVYAGAIMVLVMFVLMLLNKKLDRGDYPPLLGGLLAGIITAALAGLFVSRIWRALPGAVESGVDGSTEALGLALFSDHVIAFELTSLIILTAVIGAVVLGKREN